ncbi:MAG: hypothetical protein ACR2K0_10115 [Acidimicrobiales bacterium]
MSAVWTRVRAELRGRWRVTAGLIVLVGLVSGIALATAAGARRTATAYPRFLAESGAADVLVNPDLGVFTELDFDAVAALPEVAAMTTVAGLIVVPGGADGEPSFDNPTFSLAPIDERGFASLEPCEPSDMGALTRFFVAFCSSRVRNATKNGGPAAP